ncbi:LysR substrate-binding domain-containing protein [Micromonospora sp. C28SCA-DRY-2]|uniref:LysR family transcriptional regulator n=1 Tax=Micromonospora sp. C28SCA-DRY-2 TaxID=3059522 RepID=UPI002674A3F7|nr:LysR substrate-binding domain-containing protein [Micromonospora sp. C28SCA-DRY-2]MDO3701737.1 LysR substrate-binding domain-containing protein [Micromonospora sp. C28SCA-DRY-2]
MEFRDIEIFLTLAEELHFGRTAQRLHISQARVSQAIKAQERRIGAALFDRTSRVVTLTPVGKQLRDDLQAGYDVIRAGLARATESARGVSGTVRLGVMGAVGHEVRDVIDLFRTRYPDCDVVLREVHFSDPFAALRTGDLDLALLWRPVREPGLTEGPVVLTEGRVLAVGTGHELAGRASVSMEDFGDRMFFDPGPDLPGYWIEAMVPAQTPGGRPIPRGPLAATFHELLTMVAAGRCLTPLNEHVLHYYSHPGVVFLPVHDAPPTEWALTWRAGDLPPRVRGFVDTAAELGPRAFGQTRQP